MRTNEYMTIKEECILDAIVELGNAIHVKNRDIEQLLAKVDDLAQEPAVTQSQLEEARKRLKRCEGGGD